MSEDPKNEATSTEVDAVESPFDKESTPKAITAAPEATPAGVADAVEAGTEEVATPAEATPVAEATDVVAAPEATETSNKYAKYAEMAETPDATERRKFDYVAVSGAVETEVIKTEAGDVEKRKPATAIKLLITKERDKDDNLQSEELALPLTVVPIKYRMVMEQRAGSKGEILVLKTSECNGKTTDMVTVNRFSPDGKVVETTGPMTVLQARKKFVDSEGKGVLRDKAHVYSLVGGELVRFVVKGTGLWEKEDDLHKGKTLESQARYPFLSRYLSEFAIDNPYFLYEMKVDAAYRDHGSIKYYRPTFFKGDRISAETEEVVLEHLEDLYKYFGEMDEATKKFVPEENPQAEAPADVPFGSDADADSDY